MSLPPKRARSGGYNSKNYFEKMLSTNINSVKYGASRKLCVAMHILSVIVYIVFTIDTIFVKSCMSSVNQCCIHNI